MNPELPPDPHLQAALRHAPDAGVQAPPEIAARVLAEARRAVAPAPQASRWARWWRRAGSSWMPQGALASLLLAGLITMLWQGERPGPVAEPTPLAEDPAPAPAVAAAPAAEAVQDNAAAPAPARAAAPADNTARGEAPLQAARKAEGAKNAEQAESAQAAQAAQAAQVQRARAEAAERQRDAAPALASPPPAPPPPPPPVAVPAPAAATFGRQALAAPEPAPWGDLPGPNDRLRRPDGTATPIDADWLVRLTRSVAAPWQDAGATPPADEPLLAWEREGTPIGRLWVERREGRHWVVWCVATVAQARCQQAPLRGEPPALPR